jgi:hypothetical protein
MAATNQSVLLYSTISIVFPSAGFFYFSAYDTLTLPCDQSHVATAAFFISTDQREVLSETRLLD